MTFSKCVLRLSCLAIADDDDDDFDVYVNRTDAEALNTSLHSTVFKCFCMATVSLVGHCYDERNNCSLF